MERSVFDLEHQSGDLDAKLVVALERISEVFRVSLWEMGKRHKLSPLQIQILIFLSFHDQEKRKVSYLAKEFHLSKPTISEAVRTLLKKELIFKETETVDTRSYIIHLSTKGQQLVSEVSFFANGLKPAFQHWTTAGKTEFYHKILQLIHALQNDGLISIQRTCFRCRFLNKNGKRYSCSFLQKELSTAELQIDCKDYQSIQL